MKYLAHGAKFICSENSLEEEVKLIQNLLRKHGYPSRFLMKEMFVTKPKLKSSMVLKMYIFLKLQLKGDILSEMVT